jgi:diguanylate cyclase (GGDEF)-like protein
MTPLGIFLATRRFAKSDAVCARDLRIYDGVGRYGGEEFLLVMPNCDLPNAILRADELRAVIARSPVLCSGEEKLITMSMGVAVSACDKKNEVEVLLKEADAGLYEAKEKGRNRTEHCPSAVKKTRPKKLEPSTVDRSLINPA